MKITNNNKMYVNCQCAIHSSSLRFNSRKKRKCSLCSNKSCFSILLQHFWNFYTNFHVIFNTRTSRNRFFFTRCSSFSWARSNALIYSNLTLQRRKKKWKPSLLDPFIKCARFKSNSRQFLFQFPSKTCLLNK